MRWRWLLVLLPTLLGLLILILMARARLIELTISLTGDLDVIILFSGAALSLFAALSLALRGRVEQIRNASLKQALAESTAERNRFIRRLDHEIKNPLTAIRAGLINLSETDELPNRQRILASIENQTLRLSHLATDLRKLAELETLPLEQMTIQISELLKEAITLTQERPTAEARKIALRMSPTVNSHTLVGDPDLLLLALLNLLDNAVKFTTSGANIEIRAFEEEDDFIVEVEDSGRGISAADIPYVWEELYRGEGTQGMRGSGLGLSLVRTIVTHHKGQASIQSTVGQGTTVTLRFPFL